MAAIRCCGCASCGGKRDRAQLLGQTGSRGQINQLVQRCCAQYERRMLVAMPLRPGVIELLELLGGHPVPRAVITTTAQPRATRKLQEAGLAC